MGIREIPYAHLQQESASRRCRRTSADSFDGTQRHPSAGTRATLGGHPGHPRSARDGHIGPSGGRPRDMPTAPGRNCRMCNTWSELLPTLGNRRSAGHWRQAAGGSPRRTHPGSPSPRQLRPRWRRADRAQRRHPPTSLALMVRHRPVFKLHARTRRAAGRERPTRARECARRCAGDDQATVRRCVRRPADPQLTRLPGDFDGAARRRSYRHTSNPRRLRGNLFGRLPDASAEGSRADPSAHRH